MNSFFFNPGEIYGYEGKNHVKRRQYVIILHTWMEGAMEKCLVLSMNGKIEQLRPNEENRYEL